MNAVAKESGLRVDFTVFSSFGDILPALVAKRIDIDATSTTVTPERKAMGVEFSDIYAIWTEALVVARSDQTAYRSVDELRGQAVAAGVGTIYLDGIKAKGIFKETKALPTIDDAVAAINKGEIKGYLTNAAQISYLQKQGQYADVRVVASYVPVYMSAGGIAVRRGETDLLNKINAALAKLKADGTLKTLGGKWGIAPPT
jgi:polar amino acid transport system substrate-binding protein